MDSKWQPIETAPKDGSVIVVWDSRYNEPAVCWWMNGRWEDDDHFQAIKPSHWIPVSPPVAVSQEATR